MVLGLILHLAFQSNLETLAKANPQLVVLWSVDWDDYVTASLCQSAKYRSSQWLDQWLRQDHVS